jgi:broad specificity phosphatase PhoE
MTTLWLVRHGETDWNRDGRWQGQTPAAPPLNAAGRAQVQALAAQFEGRRVDAVYTSDLLRAQETAGFIADQVAAPIVLETRLREVNLGDWEGMQGDEIVRRYPAELQERQVNPVHARPPGGGETAAEVAERVQAAANDIAQRHPDGAVLIVSHGLALAALLCLARGLPLAEIYQHIPENGRPHVVDWPPREG